MGPLCDNGAAVDLSTLWICAGSDAEDATDFPNAYSGTGITDAGNGIFNPTTAGQGSHQIIFERCSVNDTITIQVNNCATACLPPTALAVTPGTLDFCEDDDPTFNVTFSGTATDDYNIAWFDNNNTSVKGALTDGTTGANEYAVTNIQTTQEGTWTVRIEDGNNNDAACYTELTFDVNVNPIPNVTAMTDETICSGDNTTAIMLAADVVGSTFNWTTTPTNATGEIASGPGNTIASHTPSNSGSTAGTIVYSVTATANSCTSTPEDVTININPIPTVTAMTDETICSGDNTTAISLAADVTGSTFNWTTTPTNASGEVASGTGSSIASHTPTNTGTTAGSISYSVTATSNSCTSTAEIVTININPIPTVTAMVDEIICSGDNTTAISLAADVTGSTFNWTTTPTNASREVASVEQALALYHILLLIQELLLDRLVIV